MKEVKLSCVRILIVAIVLGLVAKAIGPKPTEAKIQEKVSELIDGLVQMRTGLDLYRAQHRGLLPPVNCRASFKNAMTKRIGCFGPYIDEIPANPFNGMNTIRFDGKPAGANRAGWRLDTKSGLFQADNHPDYAIL